MKDVIEKIDISKILPNPNQPRKHFDSEALRELSESIKTYGLISPVKVRKLSEDLYELVVGERRLRASKLAGLKEIPSIITEISDQDSAVLSIMENIQRENLTFFEEARSYNQLIDYYDMTQEQVAKALGKSQSFIANKVRLLKLDDEIADLIVDKRLSERHARALLRLPEVELQKEVIAQIVTRDLNVKKTEVLVEKIRNERMFNNYGESMEGKKARVKTYINSKIYVNTIKKAYKEIKEFNKNVSYSEEDNSDFIEIKIKIPK